MDKIVTTATERNGDIIAAEINTIKRETLKTVLSASIEIGKRLTEAKELIPHGEFTSWLEKSVDYSQSTANNLMRIYKEYGDEQIDLLSNKSKSQTFGNLSYSQAVALFALPAAERENFVEENNVEQMSAREIKELIDKNKKAQEETEALKTTLEAKAEEQGIVQEELNKANQLNAQMKEETKKLKAKLKEAKSKDISPEEREKIRKEIQAEVEKENEEKLKQYTLEHKKAEDEAKQQQQEIEERYQKAIAEKLELQKKLEIAEDKEMQKFSVIFEQLQANFTELIKIQRATKGENSDKLKQALEKIIAIFSESI